MDDDTNQVLNEHDAFLETGDEHNLMASLKDVELLLNAVPDVESISPITNTFQIDRSDMDALFSTLLPNAIDPAITRKSIDEQLGCCETMMAILDDFIPPYRFPPTPFAQVVLTLDDRSSHPRLAGHGWGRFDHVNARMKIPHVPQNRAKQKNHPRP